MYKDSGKEVISEMGFYTRKNFQRIFSFFLEDFNPRPALSISIQQNFVHGYCDKFVYVNIKNSS